MARKITSPIKQKLLLALAAGLTLGLTRSPKKQLYILKNIPKEFSRINRDYLRRIIAEFHQDRLVNYTEGADGVITAKLSERGKKQTLRFKLEQLAIKRPARWDGQWRLVLYDIPEKIKPAREALRDKLKDLGFFELQRSVWVYPYPCRDEINFIMEVFDIRRHVRLAEAGFLTNEADLLLRFGLEK